MEKYYIPDTLGASNYCDLISMGLYDTESAKFVRVWVMYWPKGHLPLLEEITQMFSNRFKESSLPLEWRLAEEHPASCAFISLTGLWKVSCKAEYRKIIVDIDGSKYKVSAEKLDTLLKSLE